MDIEDRFKQLATSISKSIQESELSVGVAIQVMDSVKLDLELSTAFSGCTIEDSEIVRDEYAKEEGDINE